MSAAEEIPTAVITFISLLMFLQFGESMSVSSLYSGLLFLPFVMKSFIRTKVRSAGNFKMNLHIAEVCIFALLIFLEVCINLFAAKVWMIFLVLFFISTLCAWHDLLGRMYYDRMLYPRQQKVFNQTKILSAQVTIVLTYGVLIMFVGLLEVIFRMPTEILTKRLAWGMECYIIAGAFLVFMLLNFLLLKNPRICNPYRYESMLKTVQTEILVIERIKRKKNAMQVIVSLFFLLLPQALMFFTRVFFLLAKAEEGGLDCSIPELGFAQGTIGVIAFGFGVMLGRQLLFRFGLHRMFWFLAVPLTFSPMFYMVMSQNPMVDNMLAICLLCLFAQLFFGFGLNLCIPFVRFISGERYRNTIDYLYIPLVAAAMILPMSISGWLCELLGFKSFFILDSATAIVAWVILLIMGVRNKLETNGKEK